MRAGALLRHLVHYPRVGAEGLDVALDAHPLRVRGEGHVRRADQCDAEGFGRPRHAERDLDWRRVRVGIRVRVRVRVRVSRRIRTAAPRRAGSRLRRVPAVISKTRRGHK
jgi:hypothetical protein